MTKRHTKGTPASYVQLPLLGTVTMYARVTTLAEGQPARVEELTQYALALGFSPENISVFLDEGEQAVATFLERRGYTSHLAAIREGAVNVILLRTEDCLFTGATELQVNTFIHLCIDKGVCVVMPQMVYDFQNLSLVSLFRSHVVKAYQVLADASTH